MRIAIACLSFVLLATAVGAPSAPAAKKKSATVKASGKKASPRGRSRKKSAVTWRSRQLVPAPERYAQIQQALAEKGYLQSPATGKWDEASSDALRRFQQEQNLKPTGKIDSLSLIALGLGPRYDSAAASVPPLPADAEKK